MASNAAVYVLNIGDFSPSIGSQLTAKKPRPKPGPKLDCPPELSHNPPHVHKLRAYGFSGSSPATVCSAPGRDDRGARLRAASKYPVQQALSKATVRRDND
jgi:hypothetical protein